MHPCIPRFLKAIIVLSLSFYGKNTAAQVTITANQTATALSQRLAGSGITITNATLACAAAANGSFVVSSGSLGLDSGIVLTTGNAMAVGTAEPPLTSFNNNTNGDPALQTLSGASVTRDACILQFDLVPKGDTVKFEYVFGSEEYINSVCGPYNDAFAFFISGPGIAGTQNMAQVPGTNIPVAVNSINNGIPGSFGTIANCTAMGAGSPFTAYYNNNAGSTTVGYRGLTAVLTAAHAVNPCDTYHLKLTIADALNGLYDSGVFIKAGSLQSSTFAVTAQGPVSNAGVPALYKDCLPGSLTFSRSVVKPTSQVLNYQISGTAINGTDYATLPGSVTIPANATNIVVPVNGLSTFPAGIKTLKIALVAPFSCNGNTELIDSAELHLIDAPSLALISQDTTICEGDFINIQASGSVGLSYNWSPPIGLSSTGSLTPLANPTQSTTYTLKAYAAGSGCDTLSASLAITVLPKPLFVDAGEDINICEHSPILITPTVSPANTAFTYLWTSVHGSVAQLELAIPDPLIAQSGKYAFTVNSGVCGSLTDSVMINIVAFPLPPVTAPLIICLNEVLKKLPVEGENLKWYKEAIGGFPLDATPVINTTTTEGTNTFYVSQSYGSCESERAAFTVTVERCCDDFLFIPSAFTPNQDGINDYFEMKVRNGSRITRVEIFNRWGQMVYLEDGDLPWDGRYKGSVVDLGNYFYRVTFTCKDGTIINKKGEVLVVK